MAHQTSGPYPFFVLWNNVINRGPWLLAAALITGALLLGRGELIAIIPFQKLPSVFFHFP